MSRLLCIFLLVVVLAAAAEIGELQGLMKEIELAAAEHCPEHHASMRAQFARGRVTVDRHFQGDIALNVEQAKWVLTSLRERRGHQQSVVRVRRQALSNPTSYWPVPHEAIPYRFEDPDEQWRAAIRKGLDLFERETCIRWKHEGPGAHYMEFTREDTGAWANLGMQPGNRTRVNLGGDFATHPRAGLWNIQHETMHALGIHHEHVRYDRDAYVTINWPTVCHLWKSPFAFEVTSQSDTTNMDEPYDFGSVMHYTQQFDGDNVTMLAKSPMYQYTMGSHEGPSFKDIELLNKRYCSSIHCPDDPKCLNGGYRDPNNCTACKCPRGLAGDDCSQLAQNTQCDLQGPQFLHANSTNAYELRIPANQRANQTCYWRIAAPQGKIVKMFTSTLSQEGYSVQERCDSYLEVKHMKDLRPTGVRFCQNGSPLWTVQSETNEVLVILRTNPDARALPTWVLWYTMATPARRYARMGCNIPRGNIKASQEARTVNDCFTLCDGVDANALTYDTANGTCKCIDPIGYYGSTVSTDDSIDPGQTLNGYVAVDDSAPPRPSCNETRTSLKNLFYRNQTCPPGFELDRGYCWRYDLPTWQQCMPYYPFFKGVGDNECQLVTLTGTV